MIKLGQFLKCLLPIFILVSLAFSLIPQKAEALPVIIGNIVSISTSKGDIMVTPHTLTSSGWVEVQFKSSSFIGDVDVVLGFNGVDQVQTTKAENYEGTKWNASGNGQKPSETHYSSNGANRWQTSKHGQSIVKDTWFKTRFWIEIPIAYKDNPIKGKYNVLVKPSGISVQDALTTGNCVLLDPWYNASWLYRKSLSINGTVDGVQTNYQMKRILLFTGTTCNTTHLGLNSLCQADFDDIRFTNSDNSTVLDYWVESSTAGVTATVWVEVDTIPIAPGTVNIYMYYGNAGVAAGSNGVNTFGANKWDNFEWGNNGDNLNTSGGNIIWADDTDTPTISTIQDYPGIVADTRSTNFNNQALSHCDKAAGTDYAIQLRYYKETAVTNGAYLVHGNGIRQLYIWADVNENLYYLDGVPHDTGANVPADAWFLLEVRDINWVAFTYSAYIDGVLAMANIPMYAVAVQNGQVQIGIYGTGATQDVWGDNFLIRKYTTNEPTWGACGSEQKAPTVTTSATSLVEETTASCAGNVTAINDTSITAHCIVYDTATHAAVSGEPPAGYSANVTEFGAWGLGDNFTINLTGLAKGEEYFFRAGARNDVGAWGYGGELTFLTKPDEPSGLTCTPGDGQVTLNWVNGAGADYTYIRHKVGGYPVDQTDGVETDNTTLTTTTEGGLANGTTYWFSAWSWTSEGGLVRFSDVPAQVTCMPIGAPSVTTKAVSGFDKVSATVNGETVTMGAGAISITERGFDYGLTAPAYGGSNTETGTFGVGNFSLLLTGLSPATQYHYRAKAKNNANLWSYGADMTFSTKGAMTLYEEHSTSCNTTATTPYIYGNNVLFQTFTTDNVSIAHTVSTVKIYARRVNVPPADLGIVTISIRNAPAGTPSGEDITSATIDSLTFSTTFAWFAAEMDSEVGLESDKMYAIVVEVPSGDAANYLQWSMTNSDNYTGGSGGYSIDSGATWAAAGTYSARDYCFQIWGNPTAEMLDAKVFSGYLETGDWLIVCLYYNIYPPYYDNGDDVSLYFYLQLVDGNIVKAQTKVSAWGFKPGSIYLSHDMVESLEWGKAYKVRMYGDFGTHPYIDYTLRPVDWLGSDMNKLAAWCMVTSGKIESFYGDTLTTYVTGKGRTLNAQGGSVFVEGIPELDKVLPKIFETATGALSGAVVESTGAMQRELQWEAMWGPTVVRTFTIAGNVMSVSGSTIGAIFFFLAYILTGALTFPTGHTMVGIGISFPLILVAFFTGLIPLVLMAVLLAVSTVLLVREGIWKGG